MLVLVGGFVAYLGDNLGRKLGKKRLTFGRLRPKHTAALGTFVAGAFGTLFTIIILGSLSEQVRVWIFRGRQAEQELLVKSHALDLKQHELASMKTSLSAAQASLAATTKQLTGESTRLRLETEQVKVQSDRAKVLASQTANLATQIKRLEAQSVQVRKDAASLRSSLQSTKSELVARKSEVEKLRLDGQRIGGDNARLSTENLRLTNLIQTYQVNVVALEKDLSLLKQTGNDLEQRNRELTAKNRVDLESAQENLDKAKRDLSDAQSLLKTLNASAGKFFLDTRLHRLTVNIGDELSRIDLPAGATQVEARGAFLSAVRTARQTAQKRGAVKGLESDLLKIVDPKGLTLDQIMEGAVRGSTGRKEHELLIVRAAANTFEGEAALASIELRPNRVIYHQNAIINEVRLDGRLSEEKIADRISEFVRDELSVKAVKDGMIPATGQDSPLGEITSEQILGIVATVKGASRFVRVQFLAAQDIRAGDRIKIRISYR